MFFFFFDETNGKKSKREFNNAKWQNKANKGEWSELYALYKLLSEQNLYPINIDNKNGQRLRMPILSILRHTEQYLKAEYKIEEDGQVVINANGHNIIQIAKSDFYDIAPKLFEAIKKGAPNEDGTSDSSFELPEFDEFRKNTAKQRLNEFCDDLQQEKERRFLWTFVESHRSSLSEIKDIYNPSKPLTTGTLCNLSTATNTASIVPRSIDQKTM